MAVRSLHQGLTRAQRLRKRSAFLNVQQRGRRCAGRCLVVYAMTRNDDAPSRASRLGITVSRKVGGAVVRNKVKRWLRESYRRLADKQPEMSDVVVIAKPAAAASSYAGIDEELTRLLQMFKRS